MARILKLTLALLGATTPLCQSFAPSSRIVARGTALALHASTENDDTSRQSFVQFGNLAGASLLGLSLVFSPNAYASIDAPYINNHAASSTVTLSTITIDESKVDKSVLDDLEKETKALEKETAVLKKKARVERGREAFYDYEAKMAAETEARIEAAERKAEIEYENDKAEVEALALLELKKERDAKLASTPAEKRELEKEARILQRREKEVARKEKAAQRAERVFLAEETREKEILRAKTEAAKREDAKFEQVESEYEKDVELVKEEEAELKVVKDLMRKKK